MPLISSRVHGIIDYAWSLLLIASPWLFDFADGGWAQWVPIVIGSSGILYSLVTDYELSVAKLLPLRVHLALDMAGGAVLLLSPWIFGFHETVFWPHVVFGGLAIIVPILTQRRRPVTHAEAT